MSCVLLDKDAFVSYRVVVTLQGSRLGNQRIGTPTKSDLTCHLQPGGREGGWPPLTSKLTEYPISEEKGQRLDEVAQICPPGLHTSSSYCPLVMAGFY